MAVQKRGTKYVVSVYDPVLKRKRWVGTRDTKYAARQLEATALLDRKPSDSTTIAHYAERWLELHPRPRRATMIHYRERIHGFVELYGSRSLGSITRMEAREWAIAHRSQLAVVRTMFGDAHRDGLVSENPFHYLRIQQSRGRRDLEVLSVEQVTSLATIARDTYGPGFEAFVLTAAYCGMRPGELSALEWPRIHFDRDEIDVVASFSAKTRELNAPKNGQHRVVVLFPEAKQALQRVPRGDGTAVFRTTTGKRLDGGTLSYYWNPVRVAAGLPGLDFYTLRHFCAAHLLNTMGHEAEDVAMQLGHTDGGVLVRRLYGHPSESLARTRLKAGFGRKLTLVQLDSGVERAQKAL